MVLFWRNTPLSELSSQQWDSLCDGCGKCCLHKLEDEEDGEVYYTDVACQYLDLQSAQCSDYSNRLHNVAACLHLTPTKLAECYGWLPETCAYRLLEEGYDLPTWHPLVSGSQRTVQLAGASVIGRVVSERYVAEEDLEDHIIHWVDETGSNHES